MDTDTLKVIVLFFALVALLLCLLFGPAFLIDKANCSAKTKSIGLDSRWGVFSGCMIEVEQGIWIPLENYRYFGEE